jgi:hypothetical protein
MIFENLKLVEKSNIVWTSSKIVLICKIRSNIMVDPDPVLIPNLNKTSVWEHVKICKRCVKFQTYCIVASASPSCFEAHAGIFKLLMKGIFLAYLL